MTIPGLYKITCHAISVSLCIGYACVPALTVSIERLQISVVIYHGV